MAAYAREDAELILSAALDIGVWMLESGAEVHRVEDTVERICRAYGADRVEVFSIISLMIATVRMPDGHHTTQSRRVLSTGTHLSRLEDMNALSRRICREHIPPSELAALTGTVAPPKQHEVLLRYFGAMLAAGSFAVFFGGSLKDALIAALIGILIHFIGRSEVHGFNMLAKTFLCATVAGALAQLAVFCRLGDSGDAIMIGTIMLLIPGLALGTALRDMLCGDLGAGSLRLIQSLMIAAVIAGGYGLSMVLLGGILR